MSSHEQDLWNCMQRHIAALAAEKKVNNTFRRLETSKQQQVILAILDALAERPHGINIKMIARDAGVSVGSMYQYFPNRDAMVSFAVTLTARTTVESLHEYEAYFDSLPLRASLTQFLLGSIEWSEGLGPFLKLFARCAYHGDDLFREELVRPIATAIREMVFRILTAARARGEIREGVDIDAAARLVNSFFITVADALLLPHLNHYFQVFSSSHPDAVRGRLLEAVEFVLRSIEAPKFSKEVPNVGERDDRLR